MSEHLAGPDVRTAWSGASFAAVEHTVEWVDTDAAGHQHNSAIMRWVESAEAKLFRKLELPDYFPSAPRVHQSINFRARLWFGQRITTTLWVHAVGTTSMTFRFKVIAQPLGEYDGGLAADGTLVTAYVPQGAAASAPWPEHFRAVIEPAS
ncbi:acyl-CoA thioesterase [Arthrobacter sp. TMN-49]